MKTLLQKTFAKLDTPWKIQEFVSNIPYNPLDNCQSAEKVLIKNKAHCLEGSFVAAAALENLGHEPRLLHLRAHRDDDHAVVLFQEKGLWGAIGKSNTTLLSWRQPYYRDLQELVMSYFPFYFNTKGQLSLCEWAGPIELNRFKKWNWKTGDDDLSELDQQLFKVKGHKIFTPRAIEKLPKVTPLLNAACFLGANKKGLYKV